MAKKMIYNKDLAEIRDLYNNINKEYELFRNGGLSPYALIEFPSLINLIKDYNLKFFSLLDIGCGCGDLVAYFNQKGIKSLGTDISQGMINIAQKRYPEIKECFNVSSSTKLPAKSGSFDAVVSVEVFHYLSLPDTDKSFREVFRVLKSGGFFTFIVTHPLRISLKSGVDYFYEGKVKLFWSSMKKKVSHFHRPISRWVEHILKAGFDLETIREPLPSKEMVRKHPRVCQKYLSSPYRLLFFAKKR